MKNTSTTAVLTNDLQYDLVQKNPKRVAAVSRSVEDFKWFLGKARESGCLIVHLQLINLVGDKNAERYDGRLPVVKGTSGAEIMSEFLDPSDVVMEKNKDSGFYETCLDELLKEHAIESLVITGMQTQICVQTTAADAFFRGYNVWVPADCVVSAQDVDKQRALEWLDGYCATISDSKKIIELLSEEGALPRKEIATP